MRKERIMSKAFVIYHNQKFGDTKNLAEALAEGVRDAGVEAPTRITGHH
jgi:hypothetical protein